MRDVHQGFFGFSGRVGSSVGIPEASMLDRQSAQDYYRNQLRILSLWKEGHEITLTVVMLQLFSKCRWDGNDGQSYSPALVGSDKLEDNARGKLNSKSNSPSDFRGNGHTTLVGAPKITRQFNLIT